MVPEIFTTAALVTSGLALASGAGFALSQKLQDKFMPPVPESFLKDKLPFHSIADDGYTIICKNGALCRVIELRGLNPDSMTSEMLAALFNKRMSWLEALADEGIFFKMITLRDEVPHFLEANYPEPMLQKLHEAWMQPFKRTYQNRHYIVLVEHPQSHDLRSQLKAHLTAEKLTQDAHQGRLESATEAVMDYLYDYQPILLRNDIDKASPLLSFWATLIHGEQVTLDTFDDHLSEYMVGCDIAFNVQDKRIEWQIGDKRHYGAIVSLNQWGGQSTSGMMKQLTTIPGRFILLQMLKGWNKFAAELHLEDQKKQRNLLKDIFPNEAVEEDFEAALSLIRGTDNSFYTYQCSFILIADSEAELKELVDQVRRIYKGHSYIPVHEGGCLEAIWMNLFPGSVQAGSRQPFQSESFIRPSHIMSQNIASMMIFPSESIGIPRSDWGEGAIRLFKTSTGGAYSLQLHSSSEKEAPANFLVIAPTGCGKTTLLQHLIGGALRHTDVRAYIFDRFNGTKIFTESVGGNYIDLSDYHKPMTLNPFVCPNTPDERAFLIRFLNLLAGLDSISVKEESRRAVQLLFGLPPEQRVLSHVYHQLFSKHGELASSLQPWVGNGERAHWFNGTHEGKAFDPLSFEASRLVSFDITAVTEDDSLPEETAAVITYLLHRILRIVRTEATPFITLIEETAAPLKSEFFKRRIGVLLKEIRKLRGSVGLCFQDIGDLVNSGISSVIIKQCPTWFLFPNASATREEYAVFDLTDAEWNYIKGKTAATRNLKHSVLVKKKTANGNPESVILDIDLSPLGAYLKLYRSGSEPVKLVHELQQQWGSAWIDTYLSAA